MIFESTLISATNTDVLSVGRLNSIPYDGLLTLWFLADLGTDAANFSLTLQRPGGQVPVDGQRVWASGAGVDMLMDKREAMQFDFQVPQGGHFTVSLTETGTAVCAFVAVLNP